MINNDYYSQNVHGPYELHDVGNLALEEGGTIRGCQLAYAAFGRLNAAKDNAILIPTWYSGTNKIIEQVYIGTGRALDPGKYFIIIVNQLGNGLSSSPHNTPPPAGMGNFPHVRIADDVRVQHKLVTEKFGLASLALVVGGSMAKHFQISITDDTLSFTQNPLSIAAEAALDGIYVIRTNLLAAQSDAAATVRAYKSLSGVEHAFRSLKTVDLELRSVFHWTAPRVRAHDPTIT